MVICYIALGSNLGDRDKNIREAIAKINQLKKTKLTKTSSVIETVPVGGPAQSKFLNATIEIETDLSAYELLLSLQKIESDLGRIHSLKNGPRTIDLDILFYGDKKIENNNLIVPHPRIKEREFVLIPLREIAPSIVNVLLRHSTS